MSLFDRAFFKYHEKNFNLMFLLLPHVYAGKKIYIYIDYNKMQTKFKIFVLSFCPDLPR